MDTNRVDACNKKREREVNVRLSMLPYPIRSEGLPDSIRHKTFRFPSKRARAMQVVVRAIVDQDMHECDRQAAMCDVLDLDLSSCVEHITDLAAGRLPSSFAMCPVSLGGAADFDRLLWFAVDKKDRVVVLDVTDWLAIAGNRYCDFSCVKYGIRSRPSRVMRAMDDVTDAVKAVSSSLTSEQRLDLMEKLKSVRDVMTSDVMSAL